MKGEAHGKMHEEKELDIEKIDKFYDFCYKINASPVFVLTGGHPLLSDKLEKMLEYIDDKYRRRGKLSTIFILNNFNKISMFFILVVNGILRNFL